MIKIHNKVKKGDSTMLEVDYDTLVALRIVAGAVYPVGGYGKELDNVRTVLDRALGGLSLSKVCATYKVIEDSGIKFLGKYRG